MKKTAIVASAPLLLNLDIQFFAQTKASDLINPEVLADAISAELPTAIRFTPYAVTDNTLTGQPGDTITRPKYGYVGPAEDLTEGVPMDTSKMSMTTTQVTVKEAGKAIEVTEKAVITNVTGTLEEAKKQLTKAMADKVEIDYLATLGTSLLTSTLGAETPGAILDAIDVFGDEDEQSLVLFVHPKDYTKLVKNLFAVGGSTQETAVTKAQVSELVGVKDIVKTKRLTEGTSYLQKFGAVEIVNKKKVNLETDYDILARTHVLAANAHYTTNLRDDNGVVKITKA
ncbi:N4-gp56 family major capsid protein [Kurthia populi]|uniref:N4-gp56 family major capsid protein n=1 Tax=Kurthia populi TaxID=1562132 RepID=A0ABW5XWX3_9BACL